FSPVYVAQSKGYFADNWLSVTTEHGDEPVGVDLIATGERDFGLISGEQVLAARANGRPVVSVYEWYQKYPVGIVYPDGAGISSVTDLAGRNIGIPGRFGASYSGLTALLSANGMTEQDIDLEEIGFNAPEVFCVGGVEAAVVYINNEPLQIARRAEAGDCGSVASVSVFPVADAVDMVSNGLVTNEALIAGQPDLVTRMVRAFDAGLRDAIANPAEAYLISADFVEGLPLSPELQTALESEAADQRAFLAASLDVSRETLTERRDALTGRLRAQFTPDELVQFEVLISSIALWDADRLGLSEAASWAQTQDVLLAIGYIPELADASGAFTNAFLPE
ncbi:MAG TPA: ABC transporter substrate-binding protein, partial [Candidatus Limnocylindrales bacterium]|nr:ABC transporter substrate-binding protein [Candidatus Limnocylindrales bacterium]